MESFGIDEFIAMIHLNKENTNNKSYKLSAECSKLMINRNKQLGAHFSGLVHVQSSKELQISHNGDNHSSKLINVILFTETYTDD